MMKKNSILPFILTLFIACNIDTNTTDRQTSDNVENSKKDGLFIKEYVNSNPEDSVIKIKQAWLEQGWKNKARIFGPVEKEKLGMYQCVFITEYLDSRFNPDRFILDWYMENKENGYFGQSHGNFVMSLKQEHIPDTISVKIYVKNAAKSDTIEHWFHLVPSNK